MVGPDDPQGPRVLQHPPALSQPGAGEGVVLAPVRELVPVVVHGVHHGVVGAAQLVLKLEEVGRVRENQVHGPVGQVGEDAAAVPLDDQELERITRFASSLIHKEVVVSTHVDESILGGVVIQIGDQLLDGSTRARLEELRKQLRSEVLVPGP